MYISLCDDQKVKYKGGEREANSHLILINGIFFQNDQIYFNFVQRFIVICLFSLYLISSYLPYFYQIIAIENILNFTTYHFKSAFVIFISLHASNVHIIYHDKSVLQMEIFPDIQNLKCIKIY